MVRSVITHVAIKDVNSRVWSLPSPNRHGDVFRLIQAEGDPSLLLEQVQGFLNDSGEFLTRLEAWHEAYRCGQVLGAYNPVNPSQRSGEPRTEVGPLFSEDIW
jgi:hypothetical protein